MSGRAIDVKSLALVAALLSSPPLYPPAPPGRVVEGGPSARARAAVHARRPEQIKNTPGRNCRVVEDTKTDAKDVKGAPAETGPASAVRMWTNSDHEYSPGP